MNIIYTNSNGNIDCDVFNKEIQYATCARCKHNLLGDFIQNKTCSACLAQSGTKARIYYQSAHGTPPNTKIVNKGYVLVAEDLPTLSETGWKFIGWNKTVGSVINENTLITASWIETPAPPISYFEPLRYIETAGNKDSKEGIGQYIDIPYAANSDMIFYLTAKIKEGPIGTSIADTAKTIVAKHYGNGASGTGISGAGDGYIYFLYNEDCYSKYGDKIKIYQGEDGNKYYNDSTKAPHTYIINYYDKIKVIIRGEEKEVGYIQVDNNELKRFEDEVTSYTAEKNVPFSLGSWGEWGADGKQEKTHLWCATSKIYGLYIKNGRTGKAVINLVPVIVIKPYTDKEGNTYEVGTVGVYDETTNEFYTNNGQGTLGYEKQDGTHVLPTLNS